MKLIELHDEQPLIIHLLQGCVKREEPVYLPLGAMRYYLRRIQYVPPADWADGDYWNLTFSRTADSVVTSRRITYQNADSWYLQKEVGASVDIRWKMTEQNETT